MAMTQINVAEATGPALDWLAAKCEGDWILALAHFLPNHSLGRMNFSTNWSQGGPIIEREKIDVEYAACIQDWRAVHPHHHLDIKRPASAHGDTALVAAMRAYAIAKLGPIVKVPEELL